MKGANELSSLAKLKRMVAWAVLGLALPNENVTAQVVVPKQEMTMAASMTLDGYLNGQTGMVDEGYSPAFSSGALTFYMKTYRDPTNFDEQIQMFFQVNVTAPDLIHIDLDVDHNHATTCDVATGGCVDRQIVIAKNPKSTTVFDVLATGATANPRTAQLFSSPGPPWTAELRLSLSDLGLSFIPSLMGMRVELNTFPTPTTYPWNIGSNQMKLWAHVRSRNPIDFAIVLDNSGSMLSTDGLVPPVSRWDRAKRATDLFAATLAVFADPNFSDKLGVSQYSWTCGDPNQMTGDHTGDLKPFLQIPAPSTLATTPFTANIATSPASNNCTPIHRGVEWALNYQGGSPATGNVTRDRVVLLLSDGLHNMPSTTFPWDFTPEQERLVQVRTVAVGPDGIVNTPLLDQIAGSFRGWWPGAGGYTNTQTFAELLRAHVETLEDPFVINSIPEVSGTYDPGPVSKLVFIGVWDTPAQAQTLTVQQGNATPTPTHSYVSTQTGYAMKEFDNPPSGGGWTVTSPIPTPNQRYALADLRVYAQYAVEQRPYEAGEPIVLEVSLRDRGEPVLGAEVAAEIDKPNTGLGNYLSTIQEDCSFAPPRLPKRTLTSDSLRVVALTAGTPNVTPAVTPPGAQDPLPGRYQLAAADFARCRTPGLRRDSLPGQHLYDDGSHSDLVPGNGVYTLGFGATGIEGTHNFTYHVRGRTADGIEFTRTRRLSRYVRIVPDADATDQAIQLGDTAKALQIAHVFFLPRDRLGNYLGPGFAGSFQVRSVGAELLGPVIDMDNGYYRQTIRYASRGGEPTVTVEIPGTTFKKVIGRHPTPAKPTPLLTWLCIIIILTLLFLLLWRWKSRAA